jgi:hypothetical protein
MAEPRETYGRYCLPVDDDLPLKVHPAYLPAMIAWLCVTALSVASHHGYLHLGRAAQFVLDLFYITAVIGLLILMVWIRTDNRRTARANRRAQQGNL